MDQTIRGFADSQKDRLLGYEHEIGSFIAFGRGLTTYLSRNWRKQIESYHFFAVYLALLENVYKFERNSLWKASNRKKIS